MKSTTTFRASTNPPANCRAVTCLMTRNKGIPVSKTVAGTDVHAMANEEALMGVGILGARPDGQAFARVGIYGFEDGRPRLRFPLDFNMRDGAPVMRAEKNGRRISEPEKALTNWVQAGLFDISKPDGDYYLQVDAINAPAHESGFAAEVVKDAVRGTFPERRIFAEASEIEASTAMFDRYMQHRDEEFPPNFMAPQRTSLLSPEQVSEGEVIEIHQNLFRSLAINRFSGGLRSQTPEFEAIRKAFIHSLNEADRTLGYRPVVVKAKLDASYGDLFSKSKQHIGSLGLQAQELQRRVSAITMGLQALRAYYLQRTEKGKVKMIKAVDTENGPRPMFTMVSGVPIQIRSNFMSNGEFPFEGERLFMAEPLSL